jgi:ribosomal protein L40E
MKGPLNVIRRRRAERPVPEADAEQVATDAPTTAQPAADAGPAPAADPATRTATDDAATQASTAPAGQEPVPTSPSFRHRGRLRRRLRYLRRVRELGFRDLGGLVFDQHRFANVNEELVRGKLSALAAVDRELRTLEHVLDDRRPLTELREPGVSVCARCGALHGSEARFCPSCGIPVRGPLAIAEVGEAVSLPASEVGAPSSPPEAEPQPAPPEVEPQPAPSEVEPQPAATEVGEREAAKAQAEAGPAPVKDPPTEVMRPAGEQHGAHEPHAAVDGESPRLAQPTGERREP